MIVTVSLLSRRHLCQLSRQQLTLTADVTRHLILRISLNRGEMSKWITKLLRRLGLVFKMTIWFLVPSREFFCLFVINILFYKLGTVKHFLLQTQTNITFNNTFCCRRNHKIYTHNIILIHHQLENVHC